MTASNEQLDIAWSLHGNKHGDNIKGNHARHVQAVFMDRLYRIMQILHSATADTGNMARTTPAKEQPPWVAQLSTQMPTSPVKRNASQTLLPALSFSCSLTLVLQR